MEPCTVHLDLPEGDPDGIRVAQIELYSIIVIAFRKNQLLEVIKEYPVINNPGVYILIGSDGNRNLAYLGESETVGTRLKFHKSDASEGKSKAYWEDTVVLLSKDENLTKGRVRYIESKLISLGINERRWSFPNNVNPSKNAGKLPITVQRTMDKFVDQAKVLVGVLGWDIFKDKRLVVEGDFSKVSDQQVKSSGNETKFIYKGRGIDAFLVIANGYYVVQKGSKARLDESDSAGENIKAERSSLIAEGTLAKVGESLVFESDYKFRSPSAAASVVAGANRNGRLLWKLADNTTLAEWERTN